MGGYEVSALFSQIKDFFTDLYEQGDEYRSDYDELAEELTEEEIKMFKREI